MTDEDMSLEELLEMLKSGRVGNINSYYMGMFIRYLEELKQLRAKQNPMYWEYTNFWGDECYTCPACKESFVLNDGTPVDNEYHYCPCCGQRLKEIEQ